MKIRYSILIAVFACISFASCQSYKTIPYLQGLDSVNLATIQAATHEVKVMPQDLLSIVVSCSDPKLAAPYNLTVQTTVSAEQAASQYTTTQPVLQQYLVDKDGNIDFPQLGKLHVANMTKAEIEKMVKQKLQPFFKEEPIITVRMANFKISVLGEVTDPGTFTINNEKINIFEALALAHDMTVYGRRDNVHVIREDAVGHKEVATLDLSNANILKSKYYYLQQNDIVYVTPNKAKATTADITSSTTIWFSIIGSLMSLASIMIALFR